MPDKSTEHVIVGAGPAGLAAAFWHRQQRPEVELLVLESASQPGGWVQSEDIAGLHCELGPQAIRPDDDSEAMVAALGLGAEVLPADPQAQQRFIARAGRLIAAPRGPGDLLRTPLLSLLGKLRFLSEPWRKQGRDPTETVAAFCARRLGRESVPLAEAFASGVFGGDAHQLEMASAFPAVWRLEQEHGSLLKGAKARARPPAGRPALHSFAGGMRTLITGLGEHLSRSTADPLRCGAEVTRVRRSGKGFALEIHGAGESLRCSELTLAVPARHAAHLLGELGPDLATELGAIPSAGIANVYLGFDRDAVAEELSGFGFLVDHREPIPVLGMIYAGSIFPGLGDPGLFLCRAMLGGSTHPEALELPDSSLIETADATLRRYTGLAAPLRHAAVRRAPAAIPQYTVGHRARLAAIRAQLGRYPGLRLRGNSYAEVSVVGQLREPSGALPP